MYNFRNTVAQLDLPTKPAIVPSSPVALPQAATILRHCRCEDCRRWDQHQGACWELGYQRYVPRSQYPPMLQGSWNDLGMIDPAQWHYCALYDGPAISNDVWVWPRGQQATQKADLDEVLI